MKINFARLLALVITILGLAACTTGPSYPGGAAPVVDRNALSQEPVQTIGVPVEPVPIQQPIQQAPPIEVTPMQRQPPIMAEPTPDEYLLDEPLEPSSLPPVVELEEPPPAPEPEGNQAVVALLDDAATYVGEGELDKAAAALERALRIEPRNASIWHDLGQIRLHQRKFNQAESMASKSNSLASSDRGLKAKNWHLIAVARRAGGNTEGADAAEAQASLLENKRN